MCAREYLDQSKSLEMLCPEILLLSLTHGVEQHPAGRWLLAGGLPYEESSSMSWYIVVVTVCSSKQNTLIALLCISLHHAFGMELFPS
jgi:hypothetical protein